MRKRTPLVFHFVSLLFTRDEGPDRPGVSAPDDIQAQRNEDRKCLVAYRYLRNSAFFVCWQVRGQVYCKVIRYSNAAMLLAFTVMQYLAMIPGT